MTEKDKKTEKNSELERDIKDNGKDDPYTSIRENPGAKGIVSASDTEAFAPFKKDKTFTYVFKKTQKLASAVYLLTGYFADSEPLRRELREMATQSLRDALMLSTSAGGYGSGAGEQFQKTTLHLLALLETGYYAGLISRMNYDVLRREFESVLEALTAPTIHRDASLFDAGFFAVDDSGVDRQDQQPPVVKDKKSTPLRRQETSAPDESRAQPAAPKDGDVSEARRAQITPRETYRGRLSKPDEKKNERRSVIVDVIRRKGEVSIKDVAQAVTGCSEKTIQRELAALVQKGVLKKEGERRWSRYSLA